VSAVVRAWKGTYQGRTHRKRLLHVRLFLRWMFSPFVRALQLLAVAANLIGLNRSPHVALSNELALMGGPQQSLTVDPTETFPVPTRWLLYQRGSTQNYAKLCTAATLPLGPSPDAPYAAGDIFSIYRLGQVKHFLIGIANTAITYDDLVLTAAAGKVQAFTGCADATYWVVGRCLKTVAAGAEVAYAPCDPYKITTVAGVGTLVIA